VLPADLVGGAPYMCEAGDDAGLAGRRLQDEPRAKGPESYLRRSKQTIYQGNSVPAFAKPVGD